VPRPAPTDELRWCPSSLPLKLERVLRLGDGAATIQDYLRAGLVDEMHLAISPILLGAGGRFLDGLGDSVGLYECTNLVSTKGVAHVVLSRR
jgi:dihydrofolate reductase